jgi:hypothetical protein
MNLTNHALRCEKWATVDLLDAVGAALAASILGERYALLRRRCQEGVGRAEGSLTEF